MTLGQCGQSKVFRVPTPQCSFPHRQHGQTKSNRPKPSAGKPANKVVGTGMAKKANYATNANYKKNKTNFHNFMAIWGKK